MDKLANNSAAYYGIEDRIADTIGRPSTMPTVYVDLSIST